jgi:hypothetical protein
VVNGVGDGSIIIRLGTTVPSLSDAETGRRIKGSGHILAPDDPQQWSRGEFLRRAADDFPVAYAALLREVLAGNMKAHQIYWGGLIGRATEPRESKVPEFLQKLMEASLQPQVTERTITVTDVDD